MCLLSVLNVFINVYLLELGYNNLFGIVFGFIWNIFNLLVKNKKLILILGDFLLIFNIKLNKLKNLIRWKIIKIFFFFVGLDIFRW